MSTVWRWLVAASAMALVVVSTTAAPDYGKVELLRDQWGIPHVFSDTDEGAMYGLGFATAQERGFQMTYGLRVMQGRVAEVLGDRPRGGRKETPLDNDRRMRTFGWARAATRIAANLDPGTRGLLEAYCEGVDASFAAQQKANTLHPLFKQLDMAPEKWTPADCLLSWWHVAQYFAGDGTRDLMVWRNRTQPPAGAPAMPLPSASWVDDAAAVVQREDVSQEWLREVERFCATSGLSVGRTGGATNDPPKFSHAWVVGGKRTTTGAAVLVSDPQTPVRNPSLWMEFHVKGKSLDARGVGMPGSPGLLIGFSRGVAWALTALGADQADLFRLETAAEHPDAYRWNGQWRPMEVHTETILVKGGAPRTLSVRTTHLGPVVSAFAFRQAGDPEVALKRVPVCETDRDTIQGVFAMMRAPDARSFHQALADWRFPSANCVYGDAEGHIGYSVVGAIPVRARSAGEANGGEALPGTGDADDWQGFVPAALVPQVREPRSGFLFSANHRPIGLFYPVGLGTSTGSMGDTIRSWRLRERLSGRERFSPADVREVHYDTVNPARREIVRLGLHLRATQPGVLSEASLKALAALETWLAAGASSDLRSEHADLATRLSTFFRFVVTPLARKYGGGESGLARFLKDASSRIHQDPEAKFESDECRFIDRVLSEAWNVGGGTGRSGARVAARRAGARHPPLGWFDSLDGFGSLDPAQDIATPGITCLDGQTIHCQSAQSYTQWVPLHDVDSAETVCPIGHSDRPDSRYRTSTMELWATAKLHPAPLSRQAVERMTVERTTLSPGSAPSSASAQPAEPVSQDVDLPASRGAPVHLPRMWEYSAPLIAPAARASNPSCAQKDPSVVFYGGKWHVFMTVKLPGKSAIEYCSFANWEDADASPRTILTVSDSDYYCAPQVFYFRPHRKWYLIYQMGVPRAEKMWVAYSTTASLADPGSWTRAMPILDGGKDDPRQVGGLDYWIICDEQRAYLFLTSLDGRMWRLWTRLEDFPHRFGHCELALQATLFEASHTYSLKGITKYLTIIEENGQRYYKAYVADRLDGDWTPVADTPERPFAGWNNIGPAAGVAQWTDNVSHGELIRDGHDETLTVDPGNLRFLFQGMWEKHKSGKEYGQFQWRIGMLTPVPREGPLR